MKPFRNQRRLTDHVDGGSSGPQTRVLLDGVVESGLAQLNRRHADPEAQAEQPRHDSTHLLGRWSQKRRENIMFSTPDLTPPMHIAS